MKRLLHVLVFLLVSATGLQAQTISPDYLDGKIWFQLKADYRIKSSLNDDPMHLPMSTLPFLTGLDKGYQFTALKRPFHAAKTSLTLQRTYLLEFSNAAAIAQVIADLKATGAIEYAERVPLTRTTLTPNDPSYSSQWHLNTIGAATAWNSFSTGSTIRIAIVDDAVERTHSDLSGNLWVNAGEIANNNIDDDGNGYIDDINGYDVADNDNNPNPPSSSFSHGTHVAGISSATSNNNTGIASIGYSCKLMCVKSTNSASVITNGYDGIVYAVVSGADVINMSWGGTGSSVTAQNIITWASQQGVILVAAAGNSNVNTLFYPAAYTECIAVAATNSNDSKASFSNFGTWVDISAPGNNIYSTYYGNSYANLSGTSMASPLVAGLCGLMLSLNPGLTPTDIRNCLTSSATNIDAVNSSYIGQLGAGRINAASAMSCISATLSWAPIAGFTANITTVTAGGNVDFTDQSIYSPTSWTWNFPGGTPSTFSGQNPPLIVYNTPGTYNVSLTVSNANGSDVQTNTNYITVTAATGCSQLNYPAPVAWTPVNYYTGASVGQDGWINGMNVYLNKEKAMYFDASSSPYTQLVNVWVAFGLGYSANPNKIVPMRIYDGTSGSPGAQIGTVNTTMGRIMSDVNGNYYTEFSFVNSPVTLPVSKKFFVSIDLTNLQWTTSVHDTLSIVSNSAGQTVPSVIWEKQANNTWYRYTTVGSWNLDASLYIHPFLTNSNTVATFTQSATTICAGNQIAFDATGSTFQDTLLWYFPGGLPTTSNTIQQTTIYNTPGSYQAILYVVGGGCNLFDSAFVNITVNANPNLSVTSSVNPICVGGNTTLTASGAQSYTWSPNIALSTTTGAVTVASPTSTITYNVQGVGANGCVSNAAVDVDVLDLPLASITPSLVLACENQLIVFDGSNSTGATNFQWSFPGGTPSSSNASSPAVSYAVAGSYTATLIVSNACGLDTVSSVPISVGCMGIAPVGSTSNFNVYVDANSEQLNLQWTGLNATSYSVELMNSLGQVVRLERAVGTTMQLSTQGLARGVYHVMLIGQDGQRLMRKVVID